MFCIPAQHLLGGLIHVTLGQEHWCRKHSANDNSLICYMGLHVCDTTNILMDPRNQS